MSCQAGESEYSESIQLDEEHRQIFQDYIDGINRDDWPVYVRKYVSHETEEFIIDHKKFRQAFANYHANIKHLVVEDNQAIAWMIINAKHVGVYDGMYIGAETKFIEPTNKQLEWEEVWFFDFKEGKFGESFDFMSQDIIRMKQMGLSKISN